MEVVGSVWPVIRQFFSTIAGFLLFARGIDLHWGKPAEVEGRRRAPVLQWSQWQRPHEAAFAICCVVSLL